MTITLVVDAGNYSTKYVYQQKREVVANSFPSHLYPYKPIEEAEGLQRIQYQDFDYYAGEGVASFYFGRKNQMYFGNTRKGHHEAQIRLVYALYNAFKETGEKEFNLILTSPYESMQSDKQYFLKNFEGKHTAKINNEEFDFEVKHIVMAAEGLGAFNSSSSPNCVIIDAGSKTLNILHLINGSISKDDSHTLNGGTIDNEPFQLANTFAKTSSTIDYDYPLICTGGKAEEMKAAIELLGYTNVSIASIEGKPSYYINSIGLLLKYGKKFELMFA